MKQPVIQDRKSLLDFACRYAPSRACERAIREGRATILGGVNPPEGFPGWLIRAWSDSGREWYIFVQCDEETRHYTASFPIATSPILSYPRIRLDRRFTNG